MKNLKKMFLAASALALSLALVGCSNVKVSVEEKDQSTLSVESIQLER
ncbi:hypothetical protein HMPREF0322_01514, partial [Desulfitobacterium hafniense DP7]